MASQAACYRQCGGWESALWDLARVIVLDSWTTPNKPVSLTGRSRCSPARR